MSSHDFLWSWKLRTGDFVVQLEYAERSVELEAENWRPCSTTVVRGVSGELEATTLVVRRVSGS